MKDASQTMCILPLHAQTHASLVHKFYNLHPHPLWGNLAIQSIQCLKEECKSPQGCLS